VPSGADVVILTAIESPFQLHTRGDAGLRAPLYCTGLGKAILSTFDEAAVAEVVAARSLRPITSNTITDAAELQSELRRIRRRGYALDVEENEAGVVCAAAPITDPAQGITAALSVSAPASRMDAAQLKDCAELVVRTSRLIAASLRGIRGAVRRNSDEERQ
jgi:DNA-binding IclR family transcriptional regulator